MLLTPQGVRLMLRQTPNVEVKGVAVVVQVIEVVAEDNDTLQFKISDGESSVKSRLEAMEDGDDNENAKNDANNTIPLYSLLQINDFVVQTRPHATRPRPEKYIVLQTVTPFSSLAPMAYVIGTPQDYDIVQRRAPIPMLQQCNCRPNYKKNKKKKGRFLSGILGNNNNAAEVCQQHPAPATSLPTLAAATTKSAPPTQSASSPS